MPELRDIDVQFISLVDKAATRDPHDPSKPRRLLLWKSEDGAPIPTEEENNMAATATSDPVAEALKLLRPLADDPDAAAIVVALEALAPGGDDEASEDALMKAMHGMRTARVSLAKSATHDPGALGRIDRVSKDLQKAYLRKKDCAFANPELAARLP